MGSGKQPAIRGTEGKRQVSVDLAFQLADSVLDDDFGEIGNDVPRDFSNRLITDQLDDSSRDAIHVLIGESGRRGRVDRLPAALDTREPRAAAGQLGVGDPADAQPAGLAVGFDWSSRHATPETSLGPKTGPRDDR